MLIIIKKLTDKNLKSIVWPPPFPPEEEPPREINPDNIKKIACSDIAAPSVQESLVVTSNSNLSSQAQTKSSERSISSSQQQSEYSTYQTAITSTSTSKSESIVQSQQSQSVKESSTCTVQSFSEAATSQESQCFSIYQTQGASEVNNTRLLCESTADKKTIEPKTIENRFITPEESALNSSIHSEIKENGQDIISEDSKYKTSIEVSKQKQNTFSENNYVVSLSEDKTQKQQENLGQTETNAKSFLDSHSDTHSASSQTDKQSEMAFKQPRMFEHQPKSVPLPVSNRKTTPGSSMMSSQIKPFGKPDLKVNEKTALKEKSSTSQKKDSTIVRGSLLEALTIAPDRPYSPLAFSIPNLSLTSTNQDRSISADYDIPPPTQSHIPTNQSNEKSCERSTMQKPAAGLLQTSPQSSAFKPVAKQTFPPPSPAEFSLTGGSQVSNQFSQIQQEAISSQSKFTQNFAVSTNSTKSTQGFSTMKTAESYSQKSNAQESSTIAVKSGFQKPEMVQQSPIAPVPVNPQKRQNISEQNKSKAPLSSMSFQPVMDETALRISPVRSRPTTPSLINKPAPIIPQYQMNLVTMEHSAPESRLYSPARELSGQPSPSNTFKAQAPRIKESTQYSNVNQDYVNLINNEGQNQPIILREHKESNAGYQSECYNKGDMNIKENTMFNQNYGQRQSESQNVSEYGNSTVQTTRKTYEEFERAQSAKMIEIKKGGSQSSGSCQQIESSNIQPSNMSVKQVFPPTVSNMIPSQQNMSFNTTNENVVTASKQSEFYQPTPLISGANQGPVCDPTPSTGSSVGAAPRGKAFGVSSAPKRGRGVLNKAALPGSRVPLCGSCNGNIR